MNAIVDSHAHVLSGDFEAFPTLPLPEEMKQRCRASEFSAERLLQQMDENGVGMALMVQRSQVYGFDNHYICSAAAIAPDRLFPVVAIDATSESQVEDAIFWLERGAVGFRLMQRPGIAGMDWLGGETASPLWRLAQERQVPICVHLFPATRPEGLQLLARLIADYPDVPVVIDHLSNQLYSDSLDGPDALIAPFADMPNIALKFTAIPLARIVGDGFDPMAILQRFIARFGADRLMWGTDISQSPGSYEELVELGRGAVAGLSEPHRALLLGGTAARIYALDKAGSNVDLLRKTV